MALPVAPPPKSPLGRYRLLSPSASLRVSPLCLGAMNFGDAWSGFMGACDQANTESILDYFYENGGKTVYFLLSVRRVCRAPAKSTEKATSSTPRTTTKPRSPRRTCCAFINP